MTGNNTNNTRLLFTQYERKYSVRTAAAEAGWEDKRSSLQVQFQYESFRSRRPSVAVQLCVTQSNSIGWDSELYSEKPAGMTGLLLPEEEESSTSMACENVSPSTFSRFDFLEFHALMDGHRR